MPRHAEVGMPLDPTESDYFLEQFVGEGAGQVELCGAVHVEAMAIDPLAEVRFVNAELKRKPLPASIVARADLTSPDVELHLEQLRSASTKVRGVRQILNYHSDPALTFVKRDILSDPALERGLKALSSMAISFDLQIYPHQMQQAALVLERLPELNCVLDHAGMWVDRSLAGWLEWRDGLRTLSRLPNMHVKLSGLGKFDPYWTVESLRPVVFEVIEHFGPGRVMFASNYPIEKRTADYVQLWQAFEQILSGCSAAARHQMLVQTASDFYRLEIFN